MKRAGGGVCNSTAIGLQKRIEKYLKNIAPGILGVRNMESLEIHKMTPGSYNLNFHISVETKDFIFRVNIDQQSGLSRQVQYEYDTLKFLQGHGLAPDVYHLDDTRQYFEFDILIEQYLEGPYLLLEKSYLPQVAASLAKLHSLDHHGVNFISWPDPLKDTYEFVQNDIAHYKTRKTAEEKIITQSERTLEEIGLRISKSDLPFQADSLNHTDVGCDNFIRTAEGLRMIDWEKPRVDDCSYDLSCFLSEPAELWCSPHVLNAAEREAFIEEYARIRGKSAELLRKKIRIREPMVSLHWILWGATKLCDLREERTSPELLGSHEEKIFRYERIARVENIEKLMDSL
ncbi:MAG: phosphotransferase [Desulfobacteraceae bacterium]|jgi:thiamine kinase-like enzyme|nr:phosphotransferase [Desulfobacteraceae bacterium]